MLIENCKYNLYKILKIGRKKPKKEVKMSESWRKYPKVGKYSGLDALCPTMRVGGASSYKMHYTRGHP